METQTRSNYRLERWIAFFLALLFFLPFVANAAELIATGSFHGEEMKHKSGEQFLALVEQPSGAWMLQPAQIRVVRENDPIVDEPHEMTGRRVDVAGVDDAFLLRGARLTPGLVAAATPHTIEILLGKTTTIAFQHTKLSFSYQCGTIANEDGEFDCALLLNGSQELGRFPAFPDDGTLVFPDFQPSILFAGDLDRDGKADFLIDTANHYNLWQPTLFLSSAAEEGAFVKAVAKLSATGC